jgi:type IV secretory pathway TrbL component
VITQVNPNTGWQWAPSLAVIISGTFTFHARAPTAAAATSLTVLVTIVGSAPTAAQGIQVVSGAETREFSAGRAKRNSQASGNLRGQKEQAYAGAEHASPAELPADWLAEGGRIDSL